MTQTESVRHSPTRGEERSLASRCAQNALFYSHGYRACLRFLVFQHQILRDWSPTSLLTLILIVAGYWVEQTSSVDDRPAGAPAARRCSRS